MYETIHQLSDLKARIRGHFRFVKACFEQNTGRQDKRRQLIIKELFDWY